MLIDFTEPFKQNKLKKRKIDMEYLSINYTWKNTVNLKYQLQHGIKFELPDV